MTQTLYDQDFYAWTQQQAALLQAEELEKLDLPNLIEELEAMGKSQRKEIRNRLIVLLMHLLKWQFQPEHRSRSWAGTIRTQRREIEMELEDSPSLRRELPELMGKAYPYARSAAIEETGALSPSAFPATCPWLVEQVLDAEWLPGAARGSRTADRTNEG